MLEVDKIYCMSSFLMYRNIINKNKCFSLNYKPFYYEQKNEPCYAIKNSKDLRNFLKLQIEEATKNGDAAIALSGGIDSAILAKYVPKGTKAYTFKCVVPGIEVVDESVQAAKYAKECELDHEVVEIYWEDMLNYTPVLMKHKGMPIHSIEVQIYKAGLKAKKDGFKKFIFGETADIKYGGLNKLLSKERKLKEYINRYSYVLPQNVLKNVILDLSTFYDCLKEDGYIDINKHLNKWGILESLGSYYNACTVADIEFFAPYKNTYLDVELDLERIRNGESKYLIREVFEKEYPGWTIPDKIPMPRATNEWMSSWGGPKREEFIEGCVNGLTGDQKWLVYALELFLNIIEGRNGEICVNR